MDKCKPGHVSTYRVKLAQVAGTRLSKFQYLTPDLAQIFLNVVAKKDMLNMTSLEAPCGLRKILIHNNK